MRKTVAATTLMPKYVSRFECIGGDCEDTCCARLWTITLDKETFNLYRSSADPELRPLFSKYVKRSSESKDPSNYGYLELTDDGCGACKFLNEAKLCSIQSRLGESALSNTCFDYPRNVFLFSDLFHMTLNLSCPEAARKALLEEDAFEFVALDRTFRTATVSTIKPKSGVSLPVMDDVRTLVFQILRTDCLEVPARLKTIGLVCERITELLQERAVDALPGLLQTLETDLENGTLVASVEGLVERPDIQVLIASNFIRAELACPLDPHSRRLLEEVASGLEIRKGSLDAPALIAAYTLGQERLAHALGTAPKLFEHYLLNEAIRELFPWSESTPMEHYRTLVFRFAILRMLLVGRAAARAEPLTQAELVETVQVFCRLYLHVPDFSRAIEKILDGTEWKSLRKLFLLL